MFLYEFKLILFVNINIAQLNKKSSTTLRLTVTLSVVEVCLYKAFFENSAKRH